MAEFFFVVICFALVVIFLILADRRMKRRAQQEQARAEESKQLEGEKASSRMSQVQALVEELAGSGDQEVFARLLEFLRSENKDELRVAAVEAMSEQFKKGQAPAFNALLELLQHPDPNQYIDDREEEFRLRRLAALAAGKLGEIGDKRAIEPLLRQLLAYETGSYLYKQTAEALEQMIEPGDDRAFRLLSESVEDGPEKHLSLSQVDALGRFGDARAAASLVAHARQRSGEECHQEFREDGVPCFTCGSSAAVGALEKILERDTANVSDEALRSVLHLDGLTTQTHPYSAHDSYRDLREPISCATIHRLAREELQRRGVEV